MMNKAKIIQELGDAKLAHLRWLKKIDHLISGMPVEESTIPVEATACSFGKWLHSPLCEKLRDTYMFEPTIRSIENSHNALHVVYAEIHRIFFKKIAKKGFLQNIMGLGSTKVSKAEREHAKACFEEIKQHSNTLLYQIDKLEKAIKAVDMIVLSQQYQDKQYTTA